MKSYRKELWFNLPTRRGFVNITSQVSLLMTMNQACIKITIIGWKNLPRTNLSADTVTMTQAKTTLMPT
jgi:hypothetical protein